MQTGDGAMKENQMNILNLFDALVAIYAARGIDLKFRVYRRSDGKEVTRENTGEPEDGYPIKERMES